MTELEQLKQIRDNAPERWTHVCMTIKLPDSEPTPSYVRHRNADTWLLFNPKTNNYGMMKKSGINFLKTIRSRIDIERIIELLERLKPDTFWNEDGDTSFDSPEEAFEYYLDEHSKAGQTIKLRRGVSLPDAEYEIVNIDDDTSYVECVLVRECE